MRAAIVVCLLASVAIAAPRYTRVTVLAPTLSDHVRAAEAAWTAAAQETDPAKQTARWEAAAEAFALVDGDALDAKVKHEAAHAALLAWKNAIHTSVHVRTVTPAPKEDGVKPRALPAREQKLVDALDRYARYATPSDPELPSILYMKANTYRQFDQLDAAVPLFRAVVDTYPAHEVAEYAANLLLDSYNRLQQHDKLLAFADELAAHKTFLDGREDLAEVVRKIRYQAKRKRAEELAQEAHNTKDKHAYDAAGRAYIDIYNGDVEHPSGDEVLYNAGVMFTEAGSVGPALESLTRVRRYFPQSRLAARALARIGKLYSDVAMYDRAAENYEEYAKVYPGEKDARDALSDAIYFRIKIGQHAAAVAAVNQFVRAFSPRKPAEAARALFWLTESFERQGNPRALITHLRDYTRAWAHKGDFNHRVIAHVKLGLALWQQSCRFKGFAGLCLKTAERTPRTCDTGTSRTVTAIARNPGAKKQALAALTSAIAFFDKTPTTDDDARHHYALAKLALADAELEQFVALTAPANVALFEDWLPTKLTAFSEITGRYNDQLFVKDPEVKVTALERGALLARAFEAELTTGRGADDLRCDTSQSFQREALERYQVCLDEPGWFDASTRCEQALQELAPDAVPPLRERRSPPRFDVPLIVSEPPLRLD